MATYKHLPTGKRFLFVHIPRTAGRFFEANLKEQNFVWDDHLGTDKPYFLVHGIELAHFHREYYEKYLDVKDIPHITIVRNPIDRFFSGSMWMRKMYGDDVDEMLEDEYLFNSMIHNFPFPEAVNWFRQQVDFVSDKTHVWKFENGFGKDFADWVSHIIDLPFEILDVTPAKLVIDETNKVVRSAKIIDNVRNFYRRDFEQLYPELATPL